MTWTSKFGYWVWPLSAELGADYPMSTATARWYANNTRHLVDSAAQTRINFAALADTNIASKSSLKLAGKTFPTGGTEWVHVITNYFPVSLIGSDTTERSYRRPANLAVSLAGYTQSSDELFFRIVLQGADTPLSSDFDDDTCIDSWEDSTTSNSSEWIIDDVTSYPYDVLNKITKAGMFLTEYDGNGYNVDMYFMRITVYGKEGDSSQTGGHLTALYVREYQKI